MAQRWWRGEGWEDICFKRVPEGWIFRAPNAWMFERHRHYLVNENQKTEIIAFFSQVSWRFIIALTLFAAFVYGVTAFAMWLVPTSWNATLRVILLGSIVAGSLINTYLWLALRPLLAEASRTAERITWGERLRASAAVMPVGQLILFFLLFTASCTLCAYQAFTSVWGIYPPFDLLIGTVVCGWEAFYFFAMRTAKRKMTVGPWS